LPGFETGVAVQQLSQRCCLILEPLALAFAVTVNVRTHVASLSHEVDENHSNFLKRPRSNRALSPDGGVTWETNWIMQFIANRKNLTPLKLQP
jgi:hypothetical protein